MSDMLGFEWEVENILDWIAREVMRRKKLPSRDRISSKCFSAWTADQSKQCQLNFVAIEATELTDIIPKPSANSCHIITHPIYPEDVHSLHRVSDVSE